MLDEDVFFAVDFNLCAVAAPKPDALANLRNLVLFTELTGDAANDALALRIGHLFGDMDAAGREDFTIEGFD